MKKLILYFAILLPIITNAQKKNWIKNYWISANTSFLFDTDKRHIGFSVDAGRNLKHNLKAGIGYSYIQFDKEKNIAVVNAIVEKSIEADKRALYFFAKPGIAIPLKPKVHVKNFSYYEFENYKAGFNLQLGSGIRWKINRHGYFLNAGYNISNYSFTTKQTVTYNVINTLKTETHYHTYKVGYNKVMINIGFIL